MTRFLVDAQLPPAPARWLTAQGCAAEHVFDFGGDGTTDNEIRVRAQSTNATIVSKDEDFSMRALRQAEGLQVVWVRTGNARRTVLLKWFAELLPSIIAALDRGERVIEIT